MAIFSEENKPNKAAVQRMIANRIYYTLSPHERNNGIRIFTLGGDAILKCFNIYRRLVSNHGLLISIEKEEKIFKQQHTAVARHNNLPISLLHGDFCEEVLQKLRSTKKKTIYIDFDACCQLSTLFNNHIDDIRRIALATLVKQQRVWFSITYCRSWQNNIYEDRLLSTIKRIWTMSGWICKSEETYHYKDGMPMGLTIWRLRK